MFIDIYPRIKFPDVTLGMPIFSGDPDEDVELFLDLFRGYLAGLGIDPTDAVGNPPGWRRSLGLLRGWYTYDKILNRFSTN